MAYTKVKFIIDGLAFCVLKNSQLEILFIHPDDKHKLILTIKKNGVEHQPTREIADGTAISIILNAAKAAPPDTSFSFDEILNFDVLHQRRVNLLTSSTTSRSYLSAPNADVFTAEMSHNDFDIIRVENGNESKVDSKRVGSAVGFIYAIEPGGQITIQMGGETLDFSYEDNAEYEICFDNDCHLSKCPDDFEEYYNVLDGQGVTFKLGISGKNKDVLGFEPACNPANGSGGDSISLRDFFEQYRRPKK